MSDEEKETDQSDNSLCQITYKSKDNLKERDYGIKKIKQSDYLLFLSNQTKSNYDVLEVVGPYVRKMRQ